MSKRRVIIIGVFFLLISVSFLFLFLLRDHDDSWAENDNEGVPIVYSDNYDISLFGIESLHSFDSKKYGKVAKYIIDQTDIEKEDFYAPEKISNQDLLLVHSSEYLKSLENPETVSKIAEVSSLSAVPSFIIKNKILDPMLYATGGTYLGAKLAIKHGWAINLSGGYHHAKAESGGGFCFYADVPVAINKLWQEDEDLRVLIIDLDAHQGNGNSSILKNDSRVFILDVFQKDNYPYNDEAKNYVDFSYPVDSIEDKEYLEIIKKAIPEAINQSNPDLIIYNSGTDIYIEDPLGRMRISKEAIIERDELVFKSAKDKDIPILMVLSGGYSSASYRIIGESIVNILDYLSE